MQSKFRLFPEGASTLSPEVDAVFFYLVSVATFFTILIFVLVFYFALKYRRKHEDEIPRTVRSPLSVEIVWTVIPFVIVMTFFAWGARVYFKQFEIPPDAMEIYIIGRQWMWKAQHPEGPREINELHVPVGRPVKLIMTSQDVIHSFYLPAFRIKQDVLPGRYTAQWFEATKPGTYHLFCAEYCGNQHSGMIGSVFVMEPMEYERWLAGAGAGESLQASGQKLFQRLGCANCHASNASGRGPVLEGIYNRPQALQNGRSVIADDAYLRESILDPGAKVVAGYPNVMPTFRGLVTEEELIHLVSYLKSSRRGGAAGTGAAAGTQTGQGAFPGLEAQPDEGVRGGPGAAGQPAVTPQSAEQEQKMERNKK